MNFVGISLGINCFSAQWGVQNKIRKTKDQGYTTCPFDEMLTCYPGLIDCLKDDFKYFCDPEYLTLIDTCDCPWIYNTKYRFAFNHESPGHADLYITQQWPEGINHYVANNFANFIKRYTNRIESFRNYLSNPNNYISFILQRYNTYQNDLHDLHESIKMHYPRLRYYIHIIDIDRNHIMNILQVLQLTYSELEIARLHN